MNCKELMFLINSVDGLALERRNMSYAAFNERGNILTKSEKAVLRAAREYCEKVYLEKAS